jgi:hypothetical protein
MGGGIQFKDGVQCAWCDSLKAGGWYWRCGDTQGKTKQPGALSMVVRDHEGTVRWYSMVLGFRC